MIFEKYTSSSIKFDFINLKEELVPKNFTVNIKGNFLTLVVRKKKSGKWGKLYKTNLNGKKKKSRSVINEKKDDLEIENNDDVINIKKDNFLENMFSKNFDFLGNDNEEEEKKEVVKESKKKILPLNGTKRKMNRKKKKPKSIIQKKEII